MSGTGVSVAETVELARVAYEAYREALLHEVRLPARDVYRSTMVFKTVVAGPRAWHELESDQRNAWIEAVEAVLRGKAAGE